MTRAELAAVFEPLHRNYLRRLDEMAARVPPGDLLRESTTRGPDGGLLLGADGLPCIFDVANARTAETFEVRGAAPDALAGGGGAFGSLEVQLLPGNWEALPLACTFTVVPTQDELLDLADLVRGWAQLAAQGAFAEPSCAPWSGRLHSVRFFIEPAALSAVLDMGSCPPAALGVLVAALEGRNRDATSIDRVVLGGRAEQ